jgi:Predicted integral membrane metal-binding protein (DUF2296).
MKQTERRIRRFVFCLKCETKNGVATQIPRSWRAFPFLCYSCHNLQVVRVR